jgi:hypothetical protein
MQLNQETENYVKIRALIFESRSTSCPLFFFFPRLSFFFRRQFSKWLYTEKVTGLTGKHAWLTCLWHTTVSVSYFKEFEKPRFPYTYFQCDTCDLENIRLTRYNVTLLTTSSHGLTEYFAIWWLHGVTFRKTILTLTHSTMRTSILCYLWYTYLSRCCGYAYQYNKTLSA